VWQEGAGSLLLLAAGKPPEALTQLETALVPRVLAAAPPLRLARLQPATLRRQLLTLLLSQKRWDSDAPGISAATAARLAALLTNRRLAYGYRLYWLLRTSIRKIDNVCFHQPPLYLCHVVLSH
jgi:hypothetical protein